MKTAFFFGLLLLWGCQGTGESGLPYMGIHDVETGTDGKVDTIYYTFPKFSLTGLNDEDLHSGKLEGKVYVASFIFTHCPTICPVMNSQMARLQETLKEAGLMTDVRFVSFSVDPERDTPKRLREYADMVGADTTTWYFATGEKDELHWLANKGYYQNALTDSLAAGGFAHSEMFVLADRNGHMRGEYDGTSTKDVDRLFGDIKKLIKEHKK